jgi:hypothetical protein
MIQESVMTRRKKAELPPDIVAVEVDNPYEVGPLKIVALASTRDDPLRGMLSREHIGPAQFEAGRLWQRYRERAELGAVRGIDMTVEPVDGRGAHPELLTDARREAVDKINEAREKLKPFIFSLLESILDRRYTVTQAAAERGFVSNHGIKFIGKRFREGLDELAVLWGLAMRR